MLLERLHHLGEIEVRATQAIDLIGNDDIDFAVPNVGEQTLQSGSLHVSAGEAAVVVALRQAGPALVGLTANESLGGYSLGIQGVELLLQPFLGGLTRVDRWRFMITSTVG
jgi:hypothetical protein